MNAVADFQKCGAGQGELCCIFLVGGPAGAECARDGSLRDFLISKDMRAKRQPVKMFPACQDPDDGMPAKPPKITATRIADENNVVHTVEGGISGHRREPCDGCPWRVSNAGQFPAEAFRISASTAYDAAFNTFACHESGAEKPAICAGFLLRNAQNNIGVRFAQERGDCDPGTLREPEGELWRSYRAMAVGNGVDPADPVLTPCRADFE